MGDARSAAMTRIALELDRLGQEVSAAQHVLDDAEPNGREEMVRRLRHIATRANQIAAMVENAKLV
jgi:hypothetical protein